MNSLLWKQWRETRGILAIFTAWMTIAVCYAIAYELGHHYRAVVGHFSGWALLYSLFAAVVLATRTSHGERTDGTIAFSAALPISMRRIGTVRIASAVATLGIPLVIAAGILSIALASGLVEQAEPRLMELLTRNCRNGIPRHCPRQLNSFGASRRSRSWGALSYCCF